MRSKIIAITALLLLIAGCTPTYNVRTSSDPVLGTTRHTASGNVVPASCTLCGRFELNAAQFINSSGSRDYALIVTFGGSDWFFINRGSSLSIRIDGELVQLSTLGSPSRRVLSGTVSESATYVVPGSVIRDLATAEHVVARLDGNRGYVNLTFSPENTGFFRQFVDDFMN